MITATAYRSAAYINELTFSTPPEGCTVPFGPRPQVSWAYAVGDDELVARRTSFGRVTYYIVDLTDMVQVELITLPAW
jgi:hypothetical protein